MTKFTEQLWSDLAREHGPALAVADRPQPGRTRRPRRRVLAGSTLAVAGVGAALGLALTAGASTPAFAVTTTADGSVLVQISQTQSLPAANRKLTAMGIHEHVVIDIAPGAAAVSGPVAWRRQVPGASGPPVEVLVGKDGTEVISQGTTGDNTGVGTWHLAACHVIGDAGEATPATRALGDLVRAAGARPVRAPCAARLTVRPPAGGGGRTAVWWPWSIVAAAAGWNLVNLRALTLGVSYLNDSSVHQQMVRFATTRLDQGHLPQTSWFPYLGLGSPQFLHYQSLPSTVTGLVGMADRLGPRLHLAPVPAAVAVAGDASTWGPAHAVRAVDGISRRRDVPVRRQRRRRRVRDQGVRVDRVRGLDPAVGHAHPAPGLGVLLAGHQRRSPVPARRRLRLPDGDAPLRDGLPGAHPGRPLPLPHAVRPEGPDQACALVGLGTLAATAWVTIPLLLSARWASVNEILRGTALENGYGARRVLHWLVSGQLLDSGRLPVLTVLAGVGLGWPPSPVQTGRARPRPSRRCWP